MRDRIKLLKQNMLDAKPNIVAERMLLAEEAYIRYAGEAAPLFRAHVFAYIMDHMTLAIFPEELLVGSQAYRQRGVGLYPEYMSAEWIAESLDELKNRSTDPFAIPDEDYKLIFCTPHCNTCVAPDVRAVLI